MVVFFFVYHQKVTIVVGWNIYWFKPQVSWENRWFLVMLIHGHGCAQSGLNDFFRWAQFPQAMNVETARFEAAELMIKVLHQNSGLDAFNCQARNGTQKSDGSTLLR